MNLYQRTLVFSTEHPNTPPLGEFLKGFMKDDGDAVWYKDSNGETKWAPHDCVDVVTVERLFHGHPDEASHYLPPGFRIALTAETRDLDPGDPENGPAPDIQTVTINYSVMRKPTRDNGPSIVLHARLHGDHDWKCGARTPSEELDRLTERGALTEDERHALSAYLYTNGLL